MAKKVTSKEIGFGTNADANSQRMMNSDGTANIHRIGAPKMIISDVFHRLTTMRWRKFFIVVISCYFLVNCIFAILYYLSGIEHLGLNSSGIWYRDYLEAFFFSTQCFTTVGFGRVNPQGLTTNFIASVECMCGVLSFAIATGLLYGRFSRPRAELLHSDHIIIAPYKNDQRGLMFRIANARKTQLIENEIQVMMGINVKEPDSEVTKRRFFPLDLELSRVNFMTLSWTIVHPIADGSPLFGKTPEEMHDQRVEFIVLFKALEETNSQLVHTKFSYFHEQLRWGAKFVSIIGYAEDGRATVDLSRLGQYEAAALPDIGDGVKVRAEIESQPGKAGSFSSV